MFSDTKEAIQSYINAEAEMSQRMNAMVTDGDPEMPVGAYKLITNSLDRTQVIVCRNYTLSFTVEPEFPDPFEFANAMLLHALQQDPAVTELEYICN